MTFTPAEYEAILARYGGSANFASHVEVLGSGGGPNEDQLTLIRKPPANAELVSWGAGRKRTPPRVDVERDRRHVEHHGDDRPERREGLPAAHHG